MIRGKRIVLAMGTRCLTVVNDDNGKEIICLYRQYDGYPDGHGRELKAYLAPFSISNGIRSGCFNGMECLAASLVAHFKTAPGGFYLYPAGTRDVGEEYIYTVYPEKAPEYENQRVFTPGTINLRVQSGAVAFFGAPGTKQKNMPVLYDGPVNAFDIAKAQKVENEVRDETPNDFLESQDRRRKEKK